MAHVFENALCTIVALGAAHSGEGLFLSGNDTASGNDGKEATFPCRSSRGRLLGYAALNP